MRIDNNRANFDRIENAKSAAADAAAKKDGAKGPEQVGGDTVKLSSGAQFATSAVSAAAKAPEVRQDKVERAKAMIADGTLGNDPLKLADALIDRAITKD
ncbi:MAG TPA: flagellar biosynthesis anti-sigma factor FlgM [Vicinamibacterales bacterium]|nr:flagellar biosynthesis anti-sigma factor FlgM [Vicinamibacterales bacterium]